MKASKKTTATTRTRKRPKIPHAIRLALERQHDELFRVQGIIGCVGKTIEDYFGGDLPRDFPLANLALEAASAMLERIAFALLDEELAAVGERIAASSRPQLNDDREDAD